MDWTNIVITKWWSREIFHVLNVFDIIIYKVVETTDFPELKYISLLHVSQPQSKEF